MPVIYIDILVILNLFIDFLLLSACAHILRLPRRRFRVVLGAVAGGLSTCIILVPSMPPVLTLLYNFAVAAVLIAVAFAWGGWLAYLRRVITFYIISAIFAGISFAVWYFIAPAGFTVIRGVVYYDISPLVIILLTVVCYAAVCVYDRLTHKKIARDGEYRLTLDCGAGIVTLRALYDTGHHLTDVFTGSPVAVVGRGAIEEAMTEELASLIENPGYGASKTGTVTAVKSRLRLIPYKTVAGTGLLPAFRPIHAEISDSGGRIIDVTGAYVAVADMLKKGEYEAIIGTDLIG